MCESKGLVSPFIIRVLEEMDFLTMLSLKVFPNGYPYEFVF